MTRASGTDQATPQTAAQLGSLLRAASTPTSDGRFRVIYLGFPNPRVLPLLVRDRDQIPADLRTAINECVTGRAPWPLTILGPAGTGKTRAALCLADVTDSAYWTIGDLCRDLNRLDREVVFWEGCTGSRKYPVDVWRDIETRKLVIIDEIGSRQTVTDFHYETMKRVLDLREERPAVYISNLTLADLERVYDDRIASRLAGGIVIHLNGADRRVKP